MLTEQTKRAIMMLPLLPLDLISVEVLDEIIGRWKYAVPQQRNDFDEFRNKLVRNYIRPDARFQKQIWCVCGLTIRTNNSAESSHAALNSYVRVNGAVSLDMFLYALERQMGNTSREIETGYPSHSNSIYAKRNTILACELSDLIS